MNCTNCGSPLADGAKFCTNCGAKAEAPAQKRTCANCGLELTPTAKFCPVCGTPAAADVQKTSNPQTSDDLVAAMQAAAQAALQQEAESVRVDAAPVQPAALSPFTGAPSPSDNGGIPTPSNNGGMPTLSNNIGVSAPSDSAVPTPSNNGVPTPSNSSGISYSGYSTSGYSTSGTSTAAPAAPYISPAQPAPAAFSEMPLGAAAAAVTPIKKKNKAGIIIAICAAVLVAAAAIAFFLFRGPVMNLFMGNNGYAAMIEGNGINNAAQMLSDPALSAGISSAASAGIQNSEVMSDLRSVSSEGISAEDVGEYIEEGITGGGSDSVSFASIIMMAKSYLETAFGSDGVTVSASADVALTDTAKALISSDADTIAELDDIISAINDIEVSYAMNASDDAAAITIALKDSALTADARGLILSDGSVYVMFPFNGGKAIKYVVSQDGTVSAETTTSLTLDEKEISRLIGEITDIYLDYYKASSITAESGEMTVYGLTANGKLITAELDSAALKGLFSDIMDKIANDEYLGKQVVDYANANGMSLTIDDYKEAVLELINTDDFNDDNRLVIKTIVDNSNTVLAKSYTAFNGSNSVYFAYVGGKDKSAYEVGKNELPYLCADMTGNGTGNGTINLKFTGDEYPFAFKIDYENVATAQFCGRDTAVGKYTITFTPPADFTQGTEGEFRKFLAAVGSSSLTVEGSVDGGAFKTFISFEVPQYGSVGMNMSILPSGASDALSVPTDVIDITDFINKTELTDDDYAKIDELCDLFVEIRDKIAAAEASPLSKPLCEALNELIGDLDSASVPKADSSEVSDVIDELYNIKYDVYDLTTIYPNVKDSALLTRVNDLADEYDTLYSKAFTILEDNGWEMPLEDFNDLRLEAQALDEKKEQLISDLKTAEENAKNVDIDYGEASYDELIDIIIDLEDRLYSVALYNYDVISEDETLTELFNEASDAYDDVYEDYLELNDSMNSGSLPVQLMRNLRKSTEALAKAVEALESAIPGTYA